MLYESAREFAEAVRDTIGQYLPDGIKDAEVFIQDVGKNNGVSLTGISIKQKDINIAPVIYVDKYFEQYSSGDIEFEEACREIVRIHMEHQPKADFNPNEILDIEKVKDKIAARLVAVATNEELLANMPHTEVGPGLAAIYQINLEQGSEGVASVKISNQIAEQLGVTADVLHALALQNMNTLSRPVKQSMNEIMKDMMMPNLLEMTDGDVEQAEIMFEQMAPENPMTVISNASKINGAIVIIDNNFMDQVAEKLGSQTLYALPSSVHEMIILPTDGINPEDLNEMVAQVDATEVSPEERLSGYAYGYDAETHTLYRATDERFQQRVEEESQEMVTGRHK